MSNALLSEALILAKAMWLVKSADPGACEIIADLTYPAMALTLSLDDFTNEYLCPALGVALERKRPLVKYSAFETTSGHLVAEECRSGWGIHGRLRRFYDLSNDTMPARIEMRVGEDDEQGASKRQDDAA